MNLPTVATAAALVNNAISVLKNARDLAKDSTDTDLKEKISDAYDVLLDLKAKTMALDEENRQLKEQIASEALYIGPIPPFGYFYSADDLEKQHPFCPKCYQSYPRQKAFMGTPIIWGDGVLKRRCRMCKHEIFERSSNAPYDPYGGQ